MSAILKTYKIERLVLEKDGREAFCPKSIGGTLHGRSKDDYSKAVSDYYAFANTVFHDVPAEVKAECKRRHAELTNRKWPYQPAKWIEV